MTTQGKVLVIHVLSIRRLCSERLSFLPKATQLLSGKARLKTRVSHFPYRTAVSHPLPLPLYAAIWNPQNSLCRGRDLCYTAVMFKVID